MNSRYRNHVFSAQQAKCISRIEETDLDGIEPNRRQTQAGSGGGRLQRSPVSFERKGVLRVGPRPGCGPCADQAPADRPVVSLARIPIFLLGSGPKFLRHVVTILQFTTIFRRDMLPFLLNLNNQFVRNFTTISNRNQPFPQQRRTTIQICSYRRKRCPRKLLRRALLVCRNLFHRTNWLPFTS
jgi:hypothetical protein